MGRDHGVPIENDWIAYFAELRKFFERKRGREPYLPSPSDIAARSRDVLWLEQMGFCRAFIVNVMEYDNPSIDRVRQMVGRHGPAETYERLRDFLLPTPDYRVEDRWSGSFCHQEQQP